MNKPLIHPAHSPMGQPPPQQIQPVYISTNPNGLAHAAHNMSLVDANEVVEVNTDDEASSAESIDETPPDTPHMSTKLSGTVANKTSSNKKYAKIPVLPRNKVSHPIMYSQSASQAPVPHIVQNTNQQISIQSDNLILSPTVSPHQQSQQQQTNMNINVSNLSGSNNNLVTSAVLIPNKPTGIVTTPSMPGFGPSVLLPQYAAAQHHIQQGIQQSQINTTYHYHTQQMPLNNRASILPIPNTTAPGAQPAPTYRLPPYHVQPNGEVLYPYPTTIAYMPSTGIPLSRPSSHQTHPAVPVIPPPTLAGVSVKHSASLAAYPTTSETKVMSCFNCGAHSHMGRDCQESSIEEVTRSTIYKLDYNSSAVVDLKPDLDNGLDTSSLPPVTNK